MIPFLLDILQFALQATVIVISGLVIIAFIASLVSKNKDSQEVKITDLNKRFTNLRRSVQKKLLSKKDYKKLLKSEKTKDKKDERPTAYVLEVEGDIKASA
ncbi:MAG: hypothetical protein MJK18_01210, partial [Bdellovibrionales bacterium]|nr:hypothetical protein [Bdellovibrionales bacterium]